MKKVLFIDRDGTLIEEPKDNFQVDSIEKLVFYPKLLSNLSKIAEQLDYELVLVTNQDGLGTASFPEEDFWPAQKMMLQILKSEGIEFSEICIDRSFPQEKSPNRKPGTGMLTKYFSKEYDLSQSYVIGDRWTDVELAKNLGAKAILIHAEISLGEDELGEKKSALESVVSLKTSQWNEIYDFLNRKERVYTHRRTTRETDVRIKLNLDGQGEAKITTGIPFFDHMLEQIPRHSGIDLEIQTIGDLEIDEHHTIEDTALSLGEAIAKAIQDKRGMNRYGFCLPMDDCLAQVALDLGGRPYLVWNAEFKREMIGKMPCEMFYHFFKSFSDGAKCNLNIKAEGKNEHHKIEGIFKAFARSLGMAVERNKEKNVLPSTKGVL